MNSAGPFYRRSRQYGFDTNPRQKLSHVKTLNFSCRECKQTNYIWTVRSQLAS